MFLEVRKLQPTSMSLPENVDAFVKVFLGALGGTSTKQVVLTVTPAPSSTSSTGYEVSSLTDTLAKTESLGVGIFVQPYSSSGRTAAIVEFPGGYVEEIHEVSE
jgi:hypothetical protein